MVIRRPPPTRANSAAQLERGGVEGRNGGRLELERHLNQGHRPLPRARRQRTADLIDACVDVLVVATSQSLEKLLGVLIERLHGVSV